MGNDFEQEFDSGFEQERDSGSDQESDSKFDGDFDTPNTPIDNNNFDRHAESYSDNAFGNFNFDVRPEDVNPFFSGDKIRTLSPERDENFDISFEPAGESLEQHPGNLSESVIEQTEKTIDDGNVHIKNLIQHNAPHPSAVAVGIAVLDDVDTNLDSGFFCDSQKLVSPAESNGIEPETTDINSQPRYTETEARFAERSDTEAKFAERTDMEAKFAEHTDAEAKFAEYAETEAKFAERADAEAKFAEYAETEAKFAENTETEAKSVENAETEVKFDEHAETEAKFAESTETKAKSAENSDTEAREVLKIDAAVTDREADVEPELESKINNIKSRDDKIDVSAIALDSNLDTEIYDVADDDDNAKIDVTVESAITGLSAGIDVEVNDVLEGDEIETTKGDDELEVRRAADYEAGTLTGYAPEAPVRQKPESRTGEVMKAASGIEAQKGKIDDKDTKIDSSNTILNQQTVISNAQIGITLSEMADPSVAYDAAAFDGDVTGYGSRAFTGYEAGVFTGYDVHNAIGYDAGSFTNFGSDGKTEADKGEENKVKSGVNAMDLKEVQGLTAEQDFSTMSSEVGTGNITTGNQTQTYLSKDEMSVLDGDFYNNNDTTAVAPDDISPNNVLASIPVSFAMELEGQNYESGFRTWGESEIGGSTSSPLDSKPRTKTVKSAKAARNVTGNVSENKTTPSTSTVKSASGHATVDLKTASEDSAVSLKTASEDSRVDLKAATQGAKSGAPFPLKEN